MFISLYYSILAELATVICSIFLKVQFTGVGIEKQIIYDYKKSKPSLF